MSVTAAWTTEGPDPRGRRVQIAIVSPDILARIRQVFASKGLTVQIDRLPLLEFTVAPGPGAVPAAAALGDALSRLIGPALRTRPEASAGYRLSLVVAPDAAAAPQNPDGPDRRTRRDGRVSALSQQAESGTSTAAVAPPPGHPLSPREAEVMACISLGLPNADIAARLRVSRKTVKNHVNHIFAKLGARNRVEAVLIWQGGRATERRLSRPAPDEPRATPARPAAAGRPGS